MQQSNQDTLLLEVAVIEGPHSGRTIQVDGTTARIGRTKASKLQIKDPSVSERHAEVVYKQNSWYIQELGSSNGTCLNGKAVEKTDGLVALKDGDLIKLGTDSVVRIKITQPTNVDVTVQQFLETEYSHLEETIRAQAEQLGQQMRKTWTREKQLLVESSNILS